MERTLVNKFDAYEAAPCLTWTDERGEEITESFETESERDAAFEEYQGAKFWTLYGHRAGQGVEAIGDFTTETAALNVLYSITGTDLPCIQTRTIYQLPHSADSVITLRLSLIDAGQILDGLECRAASWRTTAGVLDSGNNLDNSVIEECSNAREATGIADHYASIIAAIRAQLPTIAEAERN